MNGPWRGLGPILGMSAILGVAASSASVCLDCERVVAPWSELLAQGGGAAGFNDRVGVLAEIRGVLNGLGAAIVSKDVTAILKLYDDPKAADALKELLLKNTYTRYDLIDVQLEYTDPPKFEVGVKYKLLVSVKTYNGRALVNQRRALGVVFRRDGGQWKYVRRIFEELEDLGQ